MIWRFDKPASDHSVIAVDMMPAVIGINFRKISGFAELFHHAPELVYA